jgi:hypothetical protein
LPQEAPSPLHTSSRGAPPPRPASAARAWRPLMLLVLLPSTSAAWGPRPPRPPMCSTRLSAGLQPMLSATQSAAPTSCCSVLHR